MKKKALLSLALLFLLLLACRKDFVVTNIDNKTITVNSPANNLLTSSNVVTFWWEPLDGAEKYNLQIVKPNFANLTQLVTDTSLAATKINISLQAGNYQWRIKATNAGHSTAYQTYSLKVDSSNVLTNQLVIPIAPLSGYITRDKSISFSWNPLSAASSYSVEIKLNNAVINYTTTTATSYQYTFPITTASNNVCSWRVKALNASSISQYNSAQSFTIDNLPPAVSIPTLPATGSTVADSVSLVWKRQGGTDTKTDSLYIYTDVNFVNLARKVSVITTKIKINQIDVSNPLPVGSSSTTPIQYWWRLKSVDSLGNTSGFSSSYNFLLY